MTPTFWCATNLLTFMMMALLAAGYFLFFDAQKLNDFELDYGTMCQNTTVPGKCRIQFTLDTDLKDPTIYYRLDNFYHNHRSFIRSRDFKQLAGMERTIPEASRCYPMITNSELQDHNWYSGEKSNNLVSTDLAYPCGNIAKY